MTDDSRISFKRHGLFILAVALLSLTFFICYFDWQSTHRGLTFAMLDIGQGDALFIESPTGTQVLIDGGPPGRVLSKLSRVMPFFDRSIDAIVITNPDADHIAGFADVLKNYKVSHVFEPGTYNDSRTYVTLEEQIKNKNIPDVIAHKGMRIDLGGGAFIDVLFPDRDVSTWTTNDGSIIARLSYGNTSIMLTGDATRESERIVLEEYPKQYLHSDILKVGHHGSRTSTSREFVVALHPQYALISDGKANKYGHPHQETLDTLNSSGVTVFRTDLLGSIIMKSDGQKETFSFMK
jgi:competence protein ComEC